MLYLRLKQRSFAHFLLLVVCLAFLVCGEPECSGLAICSNVRHSLIGGELAHELHLIEALTGARRHEIAAHLLHSLFGHDLALESLTRARALLEDRRGQHHDDGALQKAAERRELAPAR
jgi:hypothetical protein